MSYKKIIPYIDMENEVLPHVLQLAKEYSYGGADGLYLYNFTKDEKNRDEFLSLAKDISNEIDIPFIIATFVERMEDIKKALYTGAACVLIDYNSLQDKEIIKKASKRFGADKIMVGFDMSFDSPDVKTNFLASLGAGKIMLKHVDLTPNLIDTIESIKMPVLIKDSLIKNDIKNILSVDPIIGVTTDYYDHKDIMKVKLELKQAGLKVNSFESKLSFSELKADDKGLVPVIVQDYKSGEVLMLAYMNEEAYNNTIASGRMTYYSRSRNSLWLKGETSGHFQYLKELSVDCDRDTLLAKVLQIGVACHTGNPTCFYTNLIKKEFKQSDPTQVFEDVYKVIMDRKINPKEGSYTNYLFEKGIDKILKKCGEEAAEIIIAAKNQGTEELRYEIADFLYHLMVLMAERGLDWNDIITELAHRK